MSNLLHQHERLRQEQRSLQLRWQDTRNIWDDIASQRFEHDHIHEIDAAVRATLQALEQLAQVIDQARRNVK